MKLIDKVKPEILEILEKDVKIKYNASYELIIATSLQAAAIQSGQCLSS